MIRYRDKTAAELAGEAKAGGESVAPKGQSPVQGSLPDPEEVVVETDKRGRGRPRIGESRPWEALGISRSTYERRKKSGEIA